MRRAQIILGAWMALSSAGCVLRGKQQANANPTPPTPAPAVKPAPAPRPQPLSIAQTQAQLPPSQQISAEALATLQPQPPPVESPAEPQAPRRPAGPVVSPARPETPPVQVQAPEAEPRPTVQEIVAPVELKRLQESADGRKQEIRKVLEQAQARGLSSDQREIVKRVQSFVQLSDEAEKRGDMRQADALAERGQVLVRELQNGGR
jgi:hypothetical protein